MGKGLVLTVLTCAVWLAMIGLACGEDLELGAAGDAASDAGIDGTSGNDSGSTSDGSAAPDADASTFACRANAWSGSANVPLPSLPMTGEPRAWRRVAPNLAYVANSDGHIYAYEVKADGSPAPSATLVDTKLTPDARNHPFVYGPQQTRIIYEALSALYVAERSGSGPWSAGTVLDLTTFPSELAPWVVESTKTLYFVSNGDIYTAKPLSDGGLGWTDAAREEQLSSGLEDEFPVVTPDGLIAMFMSNRAADAKPDIYMATRASATEPFSQPSIVPQISTVNTDRPTFISEDGCELFIIRGTTPMSLSRATR